MFDGLNRSFRPLFCSEVRLTLVLTNKCDPANKFQPHLTIYTSKKQNDDLDQTNSNIRLNTPKALI
ncbi:hypothetical protein GCM10007894_00460 [Paraferrimonas haliotis]|uniref:Uncharacterized protein n=1 Tax=Paraferrimonas haliotis TaxID=2013866 RepID=A0AA37WW95_9GAMM|nr:hypothetical protein GCM10007894_00460 [Paraferrimonas haliotis]